MGGGKIIQLAKQNSMMCLVKWLHMKSTRKNPSKTLSHNVSLKLCVVIFVSTSQSRPANHLSGD